MDEILSAIRKAGRAAFRTREYAALLGKLGYARLVLHRLKARKEIVSIKNGWWAFPDSLPEAVASEMSKPGYVSFHSALYLHGLSAQTPRRVQVAAARRTRKYSVFGVEVKEYKIKAKQFRSFYRKDGILLATPEKAFADCLNCPRACPNIILSEALEHVDANKVKLLLTRAARKRLKRLVDNYVVEKRVG